MNTNFTFPKSALLSLVIILSASAANSQTNYPKLKFRQPQLFAGTDGTIGATYKFANVTTGIDAFIKIENISNGAVLINIDDSTLGYYDAWQPTVGGPGTYGSSYIKWDIEYKTTAGTPYQFPTLAATAVDVDGDNARVREFIAVNGQSGFDVPNQIPTQLAVTTESDTDNIYADDNSTISLKALGPIANRIGIDTMSQDVRINFQFSNVSKFKIYTGSEVDSNGNTGGIATNRYHCIYFMDVTGTYSVLPVVYHSFDAVYNNSKVQLSWTVNSAIDNDHFEVERSFDNQNFTTAGVVLGAQNASKEFNNYGFNDGQKDLSQHAVIYYRLKQVDADGGFSYSAVKVIRINNNAVVSGMSIQAMPNPYMDNLNVKFESTATGKAEIRMMNASGSVVKKTEAKVVNGNNTINLQNLSSQPSGMYIIAMVVDGKLISSEKVIKQ